MKDRINQLLNSSQTFKGFEIEYYMNGDNEVVLIGAINKKTNTCMRLTFDCPCQCISYLEMMG